MRRVDELLRSLLVWLVLGLSTSAAAVAAQATEAGAQAPIKFAVLAFRPKPETMARWQPLVDYLNDANIGRRFILEPLTYPEMQAAVKAHQVGVVLTQPANYIQLAHGEGLYSPLATMIGKEGELPLASFGGVILTRSDRQDIRGIGDLRGKRVAASETESLGGYLMQAFELLQSDIRLPEDARVITTGVPHDKAVYEVLAGRADAAFVRTGVIEAMQREGKLDRALIRILDGPKTEGFPLALSTRLYPEWALSAMPWLDDDTMRRIAAAILALPHGGEVARATKIHGFTIPGNYQPVEELMRQLRVPPFDVSPRFTLKDVWQRYQAWLVLSVLAGFLLLSLLVLRLLHTNRGLQAERGQTRELLRQLRDSESRYRALVSSSPDWIWEVDAQGVYTFSSPRVADMLGYSPEELIGRTPFDLMSEPEAERVRAKFTGIMRAGQAFSGLENTNRHKNGRTVVLETSGVPILDDAGQMVGYRGIDRDITARKQAEQELDSYRNHLEELVAERSAALQAAELRYRTVADFTYEWETWIGNDGAWLYCSPSCRRLTGRDAGEFMARPGLFLDIIHPDDRPEVARHLDDHHHLSEGVCQLAFRIVRADGAIAWMEHVCQPVHDEQGQYLGRRASNRDITDRRRAEIELIEARDAAMVANTAKNAFLANMSHEMRTPLHQISGMAQLVRREPLTPRQLERMDKLDVALRQMTGLIEKILELSKIESGRFALVEEPVEVEAVLRNVLALVQGKAEAKGLQLLTNVEPMPAGLLGDALHLQAALAYLADNAVKFTETGSVAIWVRVEAMGTSDVSLRFEVEDTGSGIAPEVLPRLFNIFEQADNSMTRRHGGAGIGLAMVRRLARIMGGDAGCSSTPGMGSTFWFTARLKKPA
ncbi:MAG: PhnD/SsuA/transferrin family substrate-binding protein [Thiobacillus sp.]|nr:PhnD/SsuA/transferrin family substrate-binding protein [Thiobacillus sp.]